MDSRGNPKHVQQGSALQQLSATSDPIPITTSKNETQGLNNFLSNLTSAGPTENADTEEQQDEFLFMNNIALQTPEHANGTPNPIDMISNLQTNPAHYQEAYPQTINGLLGFPDTNTYSPYYNSFKPSHARQDQPLPQQNPLYNCLLQALNNLIQARSCASNNCCPHMESPGRQVPSITRKVRNSYCPRKKSSVYQQSPSGPYMPGTYVTKIRTLSSCSRPQINRGCPSTALSGPNCLNSCNLNQTQQSLLTVDNQSGQAPILLVQGAKLKCPSISSYFVNPPHQLRSGRCQKIQIKNPYQESHLKSQLSTTRIHSAGIYTKRKRSKSVSTKNNRKKKSKSEANTSTKYTDTDTLEKEELDTAD